MGKPHVTMVCGMTQKYLYKYYIIIYCVLGDSVSSIVTIVKLLPGELDEPIGIMGTRGT